MEKVFEIQLSGILVKYSFRHKGTAVHFGRRIRRSDSLECDIRMDDAHFELFRSFHPEGTPDDYVEYKGLLYLTATYLLSYGCTLFHSVSFIRNGKAYLLSGRSGVGKTTQYLNWMSLHPDEIKMISGDMPLLDFRGEDIYVRPSCWNGKENIGSDLSAKLGGIVFLEQGKENVLEKPDERYCIRKLFRQFCVLPETKEDVEYLSSMIERVMKEIPLYVFTNDGTEDSTEILRGYLSLNTPKEEEEL